MPSRVDLKEVSGYYQALGKFVDTFANVEEILFLYLYASAGVAYDTARAIFSGVRIHVKSVEYSNTQKLGGVEAADYPPL
jgi:hypothetical protein